MFYSLGVLHNYSVYVTSNCGHVLSLGHLQGRVPASVLRAEDSQLLDDSTQHRHQVTSTACLTECVPRLMTHSQL